MVHVVFIIARTADTPISDLDKGHDGFYFAALTQDPLVLDPATPDALGSAPVFGATRIAFPLLAYPLGRVFEPELALLAVQLLMVAVGIAGTARLFAQEGRTRWWGVSFALLPAALISTSLPLADGVAAAGLIWAVAMAREDRPTGALLWSVLAVLAKESMVLPVAVMALGRWRIWDRHHVLRLLFIPAGLVGLWRLVLLIRLDGPSSMPALGWPFRGFYRAVFDVWWPSALYVDFLAGMIVLALAIGTILRFAPAWRDPLTGSAVAPAAGMLLASRIVVDLRWNSLRVAGPLFILLLVATFALGRGRQPTLSETAR